MNCSRATEIVFLYTDDEMGEELLVAFREHLTICPRCMRRITYRRRILSLLRDGCSRTPAPERLRKRILTSLPHRRVEI